MVTRGDWTTGEGELNESDQKEQTYCYKINKGCNSNMINRVNTAIYHI